MKVANSIFGVLVLGLLVFTGCHEMGRDRDRGDYRGRTGRMEEVEGTVTIVDRGHGTLEITRRDRSKVVFFIGPETRASAKDRFADLRVGDRVRAEGRQREDRHFDLETLR